MARGWLDEIPRGRFLGALAWALGGVLAAHAWVWGSPAGFAAALGPCAEPLCDFTAHYDPMARRILDGTGPVPGYVYPPFFALALWPLAQLPPAAAQLGWGGLQLASIALLAWLPLRMAGIGRTPLALAHAFVVVTSFPVLLGLKWGQVSAPIFAAVLGATALARRPGAAGALLGLATATKLYPAVFVAPFALRRELAVLIVWAGVVLLLLLVVPALVLGPTNAWEFTAHIESRLSALGSGPGRNSQLLTAWVGRILPGGTARLLALAANAALVVANAAAVIALARRRPPRAELWQLAFLALSVPLVAPPAWPHYFVHLAVLPVWLVAWSLESAPRHRAFVWGATAVATGLQSIAAFWLVAGTIAAPDRPGWLVFNHLGAVAFANLALTAAFHAALWPRLREA